MNIMSLLYGLGIILFPLYLLPSGGPQLSHIFFLIAIVLTLYLFKINKDYLFNILLIFFSFVFIRESVDIIFFKSNINGLNFPIFTLFNAIFFISIYTYLNKNNIDKMIVNSVNISALVALIGVLLINGLNFSIDESYSRSIGTFNNPNQLGYFSLCIFSISCLFYFYQKINLINFLFLLIISIILCLSSLSKAAMIALLISLILFGFIISKKNILFSIFLIFSFIGILFYIINYTDLENLTFIKRLSEVGQDKDDNLEERGYGAIFQANPIELIFGFGYEKTHYIVGHEVHSTYMSILINYGILGFLIFLSFMLIIFYYNLKKMGFLNTFILFFPTFIYGITHNGSRFTIFWIFLAFLYYLSKSENRSSSKL